MHHKPLMMHEISRCSSRSRGTRAVTDEGRSQRLRSSSLREPGTRSWLQSRYAFSVAARPLMRTRIRIWSNRLGDGSGELAGQRTSFNGATGMSDMAGKAARVAVEPRERARYNGAFGKSDIEGKAAMGSGERAGTRTSFKWAGAHESISIERRLGDYLRRCSYHKPLTMHERLAVEAGVSPATLCSGERACARSILPRATSVGE